MSPANKFKVINKIGKNKHKEKFVNFTGNRDHITKK